ncbi:helix-turn-helix domain-containing protein [Streptomyces sp. LHD-70]|uniref:helix-turn-helix domain-containing protein n=1 Tax=Streptomyces sp. LHD-70 TaxID=3072140 RepID=UPI00280C5004|nr:helix-turn-helix domain-containing protein [Streptomyces sp. LHD-70]MDQ8708035.1 helix-turn-helix domain-containing protein [Streptomyces sp. LHD-70]
MEGDCTLEALLDTLGQPALRLVTAPAGTAVPVTEVLLHDLGTPVPYTPGGLLLAVGLRADAAAELVPAVAEAGLTGLVVRGEGGPAEAARTHGVALLAVDEDVSWHRVHLLIASAVEAGPAPVAQGTGASALGDLFALANAIAAAGGGATTVEDPRQRILAYSTIDGQVIDDSRRQGILGRQVPGSRENTEQYRRLHAAAHPLRLPGTEPGEIERLAVAIRAGGEILGSLWMIDSGRLAPDAEEILAQGASTAAFHLLRARAAEDLTRHQYGDLLHRLLNGTAAPATAARRLGFAEDSPVRVVAFVLDAAPGDEPAAPADSAQATLRLLDHVRLQCGARYGRHACVVIDHVVYALLPDAGQDGGRQRRLIEDIAGQATRALRIPVRAGLGGTVAGLADVARSRDDADRVLTVLEDDRGVAAIEDVRPRVTLLRLGEILAHRTDLSTGPWQGVLAYDEQHGTDYAGTLIAYFDAGCDMAGAARLLAVHPNTCRYRLKQIREHLDIDLGDPDERLVLWLHLRILARLRAPGRA